MVLDVGFWHIADMVPFATRVGCGPASGQFRFLQVRASSRA
jgi:hypothetical protein